MESSTQVFRYFTGEAGKALSLCKDELSEIRLRAGKPLAVTCDKGYAYVCADGELTQDISAAVKIGSEDVRRTFEAVCRYSVHSFQGQINKGYVTVAGGHRAGICGTAVYGGSSQNNGRIENIKYINGLDFRIARQVTGSADSIAQAVLGETPKSILICGEPCSGKTTILRDLCRQAGDIFPVSLIDERCEIAAQSAGISSLDVGANTDVFSGFTKSDGIITAVRAMSPRMIICDEIGSDDDLNALETAAVSGVKIAASVHCGDTRQLMMRTRLYRMITSGVFDYCAFISDHEVRSIYSREDMAILRKGREA